eukprot:COSAG05_NODE_22186_length_266_cov_0.934132_1_plen_38_part_10
MLVYAGTCFCAVFAPASTAVEAGGQSQEAVMCKRKERL